MVHQLTGVTNQAEASTLLNGNIFAYRMDETSGDMLDYSGNALDGTTVSGVVRSSGDYYTFDGYTDYVNIPDNDLLSPTGGFTFYVELDAVAPTSVRNIYGKDGEYKIINSGTAIMLQIFNAGSTTDYMDRTTTGAYGTAKVKIIVTWDGTPDETGIEIYYDNVAQSYSSGFPSKNYTFTPGSNAARFGSTNSLLCDMYEAGLWNRVLTSEERAELQSVGIVNINNR